MKLVIHWRTMTNASQPWNKYLWPWVIPLCAWSGQRSAGAKHVKQLGESVKRKTIITYYCLFIWQSSKELTNFSFSRILALSQTTHSPNPPRTYWSSTMGLTLGCIKPVDCSDWLAIRPNSWATQWFAITTSYFSRIRSDNSNYKLRGISLKNRLNIICPDDLLIGFDDCFVVRAINLVFGNCSVRHFI